jgi:hypothetical protein
VGTYYALSDKVGVALAVDVAPDAITAETVNPSGAVRHRVVEPLHRPATPQSVARRTQEGSGGGVAGARCRVGARRGGLGRGPGRSGHRRPRAFAGRTVPPWRHVADSCVAAHRERSGARRQRRQLGRSEPNAKCDSSTGTELNDFVYLHLGEGLGCAVITDAEVRRGHRGLAGEIAHILVPGFSGRAVPFIAVFAQLGLRHAGSTAIDVTTLRDKLTSPGGRPLAVRWRPPVCGVLTGRLPHCAIPSSS